MSDIYTRSSERIIADAVELFKQYGLIFGVAEEPECPPTREIKQEDDG